jgi:hypothetical protein
MLLSCVCVCVCARVCVCVCVKKKKIQDHTNTKLENRGGVLWVFLQGLELSSKCCTTELHPLPQGE